MTVKLLMVTQDIEWGGLCNRPVDDCIMVMVHATGRKKWNIVPLTSHAILSRKSAKILPF
jgi:hypothetical protein